MKLTSYKSPIPEWRDPDAPNYTPLPDWNGAHVRVTVPVNNDPQRDLADARARLMQEFPGAVLHIVPAYQNDQRLPGVVDIKGTDDEILTQYLAMRTLPADVHPAMVIGYIGKYLPRIGMLGVQGLEFQSAKVTNVLSFEDAVINMTNPGLTVVSGVNLDWGSDTSNAAGKSSWVTMPFIPIFGRTFKGQTHDAWACRHNMKKATATVNLVLPDGSALEIIRTRRPPSLRVYRDGAEISMGDANQSQALIEQLTNFTWEVATNAVYIGQREIGSVFGTDKERKELFARLLGLDRFITAETKLRADIRKAAAAIQEIESDIASTEHAIAESRRGADDIQRELAAAPVVDQKDVDAVMQNITDLRSDIRDRERFNKSLEPELERNQKAYESALFESGDLQSRSATIRDQIDESGNLKVGAVCDKCGSKITSGAIHSHVGGLKQERDALEMRIDALEALQIENRNARNAMLEKLRNNDTMNRRDTAAITALTGDARKLENQMHARRSLEALVGRNRDRADELEKIRSIHAAARVTALAHQEFLEFCLSVIDRNGLPAYLCQIAVPTLNQAAYRYSNAFTDGEIGIQFDVSGTGDIDVKLVNLHGGPTVKDLSEGELRMAAIIAALAFRELVPIPLLILDEPSQGLDSVNAQRFAAGLDSVIDRFRRVMLISHNKELLAGLNPDFHVEVTKQNGISTARFV